MTGQPTPPQVPNPEIVGLMIGAYENPLVSLYRALLNPYFWAGYDKGVGSLAIKRTVGPPIEHEHLLAKPFLRNCHMV